MSKPKIYVSVLIDNLVISELQKKFDVEKNDEDLVISTDEMIKKVRNKDAVICQLADIINEDVIKAASPTCKILANYAVGFNNIDLNAANKYGIIVTNTPDVLTNATADLAWALLFAVARRIPESDQFTRDGKFKGWSSILMLGQEITGKTLGVIGAGRIGQNFVNKAKGFMKNILYTSNSQKKDFEAQSGARYVDLPTLLKESDFISIHCALNESTRHLIGKQEFEMMKDSAILINTARGPVVDESALVNAVKQRQIWGAGLDVYEKEPQIHPGLFELDNVVLLPHTGSATTETRSEMGKLAMNNVIAVLNGDKPLTCVNPEVLS